MRCRHCQTALTNVFLDLGHAPPSNAYLSKDALRAPELTFPLRLYVCSNCHLVQTEDFAAADQLFTADYAYFSSTSRSWLKHAADYCSMITRRLQLSKNSLVIEIASNDGYLLKNFLTAGIPCLGIEPTDSTAAVAEALGIPVIREFFGEALGQRLAGEARKADLICGNNVYAHVPAINDFTRGLAALLKPEGVVTLEFPHLMRLIEYGQFDTVYHEHFSYLSLAVVERVFTKAGLRIFDVEELSTHGGSLRIYGCLDKSARPTSAQVAVVLDMERNRGLETLAPYTEFQARANAIKDALLTFLIEAKRAGKTVAGYGAAAKGNTLLNYAGVKPDLLPYVCDAAPSKQGLYLPGSHIPIVPPEMLNKDAPDYVLILPWNIADEVCQQLKHLEDCGTNFVTAVPELTIG